MINKYVRGSMWWVDFGPIPTISSTHVVKKTRPCIIISSDRNNETSSVVNVIPCTTQEDSLIIHPKFECGNKVTYALCEQITTVDKSALMDYSGILSKEDMNRLQAALQIQLQLNYSSQEDIISELNYINQTLSILYSQKQNQVKQDMLKDAYLQNIMEEVKKNLLQYSNSIMEDIKPKDTKVNKTKNTSVKRRKRKWSLQDKKQFLQYAQELTDEELAEMYELPGKAEVQKCKSYFKKCINKN